MLDPTSLAAKWKAHQPAKNQILTVIYVKEFS